MKGTFFNRPLEWNIETQGEAWEQGQKVSGKLIVKNHSSETQDLSLAGVTISHADIKKVHTRATDAFKTILKAPFEIQTLGASETKELIFSFELPKNCPITDKKASYYLTYGKDALEGQLQLKVIPNSLYTKIIGLMDTFLRFKLKEIKTAKNAVEFKLTPPTSRDMANLESLSLMISMKEDQLVLDFDFMVKKLETGIVASKINKASVKVKKELTPKEYSLGLNMINQDRLLKALEESIAEVKMNSVF